MFIYSLRGVVASDFIGRAANPWILESQSDGASKGQSDAVGDSESAGELTDGHPGQRLEQNSDHDKKHLRRG